MLTKEEKAALRDVIADFSIRLVDAALTEPEEDMLVEMTALYDFICDGLTIARRGGINMSMRTTHN